MLLIVDDDPAFLEKAQGALGMRDGVLLAGTAAHAKQLMTTVGGEFSVAMVDLDLPDEDGFSLIAEMRRNYPDLPVIAISGVFQKHVIDSAKMLGAVEALQKPIGPEWDRAIKRAKTRAAGL